MVFQSFISKPVQKKTIKALEVFSINLVENPSFSYFFFRNVAV